VRVGPCGAACTTAEGEGGGTCEGSAGLCVVTQVPCLLRAGFLADADAPRSCVGFVIREFLKSLPQGNHVSRRSDDNVL